MEIETVARRLSSVVIGGQKLSDDILWHTAKSFLHHPVDVFNVARTCHSLWSILETEIYKTDVQFERRNVRNMKLAEEEAKFREYPNYVRRDIDELPLYPMPRAWVNYEWMMSEDYRTPEGPHVGLFPDEFLAVHTGDRCHGSDSDSTNLNAEGVRPGWSSLNILQWACSAGKVALVEKMFKAAEGIWPLYLEYPHQMSLHAPIHFAAWYGHTDVLRLFDTGDEYLMTMRSDFRCCRDRSLDQVFSHINPALRGRIPYGFSTVHKDRHFGLNPLGIAILRGHHEAAEYLATFHDESIVDEIRVDIVEDWKLVNPAFNPVVHPLHLASFMGMERVVKTIIDRGAGAKINVLCVPMMYSNALSWAVARRENDEVIQLLLDHGAVAANCDSQNRTALDWALQFKCPENARRMAEENDPYIHVWFWGGYTASSLSLSMEDDANWECTQRILQKYPHLTDELRRNQEMGLGPLFKEEVGAGEWDRFDPLRNQSIGMAVIHYVAESGLFGADMLASILEKRPQDINLPNMYGETPLSLALGQNRYDSEQVAFLLTRGADAQACPMEKQRVILTAVQEGKPSTEIEEIIQSFQSARLAETDDQDAGWEPDRRAYVKSAAELGIGRRQAQILHENRVPLSATSELRSFGWTVDNMVKRTFDRRLTKDGGTLQEVLGRLREEEEKGLQVKDHHWSPPRTFVYAI
ncbi:hypothetical protein PG991_008885 [Apiospora marii]|uniref:Ankyrin n=1 Tax=Apiospora marii TaxID=335849 RepID=A0ABR1RMH5_9PEZI